MRTNRFTRGPDCRFICFLSGIIIGHYYTFRIRIWNLPFLRVWNISTQINTCFGNGSNTYLGFCECALLSIRRRCMVESTWTIYRIGLHSLSYFVCIFFVYWYAELAVPWHCLLCFWFCAFFFLFFKFFQWSTYFFFLFLEMALPDFWMILISGTSIVTLQRFRSLWTGLESWRAFASLLSTLSFWSVIQLHVAILWGYFARILLLI